MPRYFKLYCLAIVLLFVSAFLSQLKRTEVSFSIIIRVIEKVGKKEEIQGLVVGVSDRLMVISLQKKKDVDYTVEGASDCTFEGEEPSTHIDVQHEELQLPSASQKS